MSDYAGKVQEIRKRFLVAFEQKLDVIERARAEAATGSSEAMATLHLRLHDFSGNAAMLGFDEIAREARRNLDAIEQTKVVSNGEKLQMLSDVEQSILLIREMKRHAEGME